MKSLRLMITAVLVIVLTAGLFAGCGADIPEPKSVEERENVEKVATDKETAEGTSNGTADETKVEAEETDKTSFSGEISVAVPAGSYTEFMNTQIIPYFEAEYPNVKVNAIIDENIDVRIAAGDFPNIMLGVFGYMPAKYAKMGLIANFDEIEGSQEVLDRVSPEFVNRNFDGQYYVPWNATTQLMIYNKELFAEAGLDPENPPKTFDEYLEASQAISALPDREDGSPVYGSVMWNDALSWGGWYWTMMSQIYYNFNDGQYQLFNEYGTDVVFDQEEANMDEFLSFMKEVQKTAPPTMEMNFFSRNIGMWLQYGYGWKNNLNEAPGQPMVIGEDVGVAPIPTASENGTQWSTLDGRAIMIFKTSVEEEAIAWEFTKFLMRDDKNLEACKYLGQLPTLKSLKDDPFFNLPENKPFVDQLASTLPNEPIAEVDAIANIILQNYVDVVIGETLSPEEAVAKMAEESRAKLKELQQ